MKRFVLVLIGIVAILIVGGTFAVKFADKIADVTDGGDTGTFHKVANKVEKVASSDESSGSSGSGSDIVSEIVKFNYQNGEGYYREVTYKDGGFRQFDNATGEMIGSSYDEDQEKLGVINGSLE